MSQIDGHLLFISLYPSSPVKSIEKLETQLISKQHREGTSSFPNGNQLQKSHFLSQSLYCFSISFACGLHLTPIVPNRRNYLMAQSKC